VREKAKNGSAKGAEKEADPGRRGIKGGEKNLRA